MPVGFHDDPRVWALAPQKRRPAIAAYALCGSYAAGHLEHTLEIPCDTLNTPCDTLNTPCAHLEDTLNTPCKKGPRISGLALRMFKIKKTTIAELVRVGLWEAVGTMGEYRIVDWATEQNCPGLDNVAGEFVPSDLPADRHLPQQHSFQGPGSRKEEEPPLRVGGPEREARPPRSDPRSGAQCDGDASSSATPATAKPAPTATETLTVNRARASEAPAPPPTPPLEPAPPLPVKRKRRKPGTAVVVAKAEVLTPEKAAAVATWAAYARAYEVRYGVPPVRNAMVNGQIGKFVKRIPMEATAEVAAYYVQSRNAYYSIKKHPIGCLLADAEKLHTEWITGRSGTEHEARAADKRAGRAGELEDVCDELDARYDAVMEAQIDAVMEAAIEKDQQQRAKLNGKEESNADESRN